MTTLQNVTPNTANPAQAASAYIRNSARCRCYTRPRTVPSSRMARTADL